MKSIFDIVKIHESGKSSDIKKKVASHMPEFKSRAEEIAYRNRPAFKAKKGRPKKLTAEDYARFDDSGAHKRARFYGFKK